MLNIEQLWKDYIAYESSINQMIADKMQTVCNLLPLNLSYHKKSHVYFLGTKQRLHECPSSSQRT